MSVSRITLAFALAALAGACTRIAEEPEKPQKTEDRAAIGRSIAPVVLDLKDKDPDVAGLGSYYVNSASACVDCHSCPTYAGESPFSGGSGALASAHYLGGGAHFGPDLVAPGLTPDASGNPAGLTEEEFFAVMRTGRDPDDPSRTLQVMPWPLYKHLSDADLHAIYTYLRSIPRAAPGTCGGAGE